MIQKLLHNPLALKMVLVTLLCFVVLLFTVYVLRRIRRGITAEGRPVEINHGNASFTLVAYEGLLRQLREKEQELQHLREQYKLETAASGSISEAVLANLNCGVIF